MRSLRRRGPARRSAPTGEDGSLLTEALVGIGLLGLITASVATLLPAALDAEARATAHRAALMVGDALLEAEAAGIAADAVANTHHPEGSRVTSRVERATEADGVASCGATPTSGVQRTTVHVEHGGRTDGREVVLQAGPRIAAGEVAGPASLVLRPAGAEVVPPGALVLVGPDGEQRSPSTSGPDCLVHDALPAGTSWVTAAADAPLLIDPLHVPLAERPIPVTLAERDHDRAVDVAPAGSLRVVVDDRGARRPDHVASGALRWFVRGDDANVGSDPGDARPVHPGHVTAVVAPCDDASTTGSSGTIEVSPGDEVTLTVALAVVTVEGIGGNTDAWLQVQRSTGCADGSISRPVVRYEGALHDGMRIALPRGEWDAWLRRPASSVLTSSVRFVAVGTDGVVRIP